MSRQGESSEFGLRVWRSFESRRRPTGFDEMAEDLVHFHRVHDDGEDLHRAAALGTLQRIHLVDLGDQACPCGGCLARFHLLVGLLRRAAGSGARSGVGSMPGAAGQTNQMRHPAPGASTPRGVEPVATDIVGALGWDMGGEFGNEIGDCEELEVLLEIGVVLMLTLHLLCRGGVEESHLSI